MDSDTVGFLIAGVVALGIAKKVFDYRRTSPEEGLSALVDQARALGLSGASLEGGLEGAWDGSEVSLKLGSHRMSRVGTSGSVGHKMLVVTLQTTDTGRWWLASPQLASRSVETLTDWGQRRSCEGGGLLVCGPEDSDDDPWQRAELMQRCRDLGLQLAKSDGKWLEVQFSPYRPADLDLGGRVDAILRCVAMLAAN